MAWFPFAKRRQPGPGAMAYGLQSFRMPTDGLWGNATRPIQQFRVTQPPQAAQALTAVIQGLGGVTAGQIVGQPLFDLSQDGVSTLDQFSE